MARGSSRGIRVFGLAFAVLQIVLQGALTVTDGYAVRADAVYSSGRSDAVTVAHQRLHDADCAICHLIAGGTEVPPRPVDLPEALVRIVGAAPTYAVRPACAQSGRPDRARAPPSVA